MKSSLTRNPGAGRDPWCRKFPRIQAIFSVGAFTAPMQPEFEL
jgi:hypothetical protein